MDSKLSAPETASNKGASFTSPLYSHGYSSDSNVDGEMKKNEFLNMDNNNNTSIVSGGGGGGGSSDGDGGGSENEGFLSGEEDFETASERPILADADDDIAIQGDDIDTPFVDSSEFPMPPARVAPIAQASVDVDDDEKEEFEDVVGGFKVEESFGDGDKELEGIEGKVVVDKVGIRGDGSQGEEILKEVGANFGEYVADKVELEGSGLNGVEVFEEKKSDEFDVEQSAQVKGATGVVEESKILDGENEQMELSNKLVEADGVKFTLEGDAIEEVINVDFTESGMTIVGDVGESMDSEGRGMEVTSDGNPRLDNGFDQISCGSELQVGLKSVVVDADVVKDFSPVDIDYVENAELVTCGQKVDKGIYMGSLVDTGNEDNQDGTTLESYVDESEGAGLKNDKEIPVNNFEPEADLGAKENELIVEKAADVLEFVSSNKADGEDKDIGQAMDSVSESKQSNGAKEADNYGNDQTYVSAQGEILEDEVSGKSHSTDFAESGIISTRELSLEAEDHLEEDGRTEGSVADEETDGVIFGSTESAKQFLEELEQGSGPGSHSGAESSHDQSQGIDGQIATDSDEEVDTDGEGEGKELFDSAALAALLKAATGAGSDGGSITVTSQDGSRLFSVERPAGLGSSLRAVKPAARANRPNLFAPSSVTTGGDSEMNLNEEEKKKLEELQKIRVKFLRLVQRLGYSPEETIASQVLYRLSLVAGRQTGQLFSLDTARRTALQLEEENIDDLNFSLNILILGKTGVGKSATINSIFGEEKVQIHAFEPATTAVREITGTVDGVNIKVIDTPGLKSSAMEQGANRKVLSSIKAFTKKCPPDIVLYVDRLDTQTRDLNDLPLLRTITNSLGSSIWRSAIVTLTHAASAPPDGPSGSPLSYEVFVAQRSHVVQQSIGQAVGDLRLMNPSLMNPVSLVENHPACRKNRDGQKVLPNGLTWRPQLLFLCYSMKILSEASSLSKPQDPFDHRKLFGFRVRSPPLPYLLSWLLQSRTHPKLSSDQGIENVDSDVDLTDLSDSDQEEEEDEYDQLPPFKPLRKFQIAKLSKEQRKAYFEEYDYRVKLLQKKQWREELRRMREIKKKGKVVTDEYGYMGEDADQENGSPAAVQVPLPDMVLPPSFDGDNPAHRYRFLEPTSQFLARPVLDTHGWDHDCGYDGVNLEQSLDIVNRFPAAVAVQITKDKKEFNIHLDSSVSAKHGENGSSMAGFDIQNVGKQIAYILRGETKFKNFKKNKTTAGVSVTFLGENVATGLKVEDQIAIGKRLVLVGSTGTVRSQGDAAYGANLEVRLREADFPIGQDQSSLGLSLVKWRGDLALGANLQSQFSVGRGSKIAIRAGLNNKLSGQVSVRTSTSDQLQIALVSILPVVMAIYKSIRPGASENYGMY